MTKDEVSLLVDLIQAKPIITSKETNANKLKDEAWDSVTDNFNAKNGQFQAQDQLKVKWDNLKKAARRKCQQIRLNNLKTGGFKPRCLYRMSNMSNELQTNKGKKKKYDDYGRREMYLAIKNYYEAKTIKANLEIDLLRIAKKTDQAPTNLE